MCTAQVVNASADHERWPFHVTGGDLHVDDVILEVDSVPVSGFTRQDVVGWITLCVLNNQGVAQLTVAPLTGNQSLSLDCFTLKLQCPVNVAFNLETHTVCR